MANDMSKDKIKCDCTGTNAAACFHGADNPRVECGKAIRRLKSICDKEKL
jgi:hypothetical protein